MYTLESIELSPFLLLSPSSCSVYLSGPYLKWYILDSEQHY